MSLDVSNVVTSRICHDIISPIGAILHGLGLISMTASLEAKSPEVVLINDSCQDARARVEFAARPLAPIQRARLWMRPWFKVSLMPFTSNRVLLFVGT
jgi:hypothetical protein